MAKKRKAIFLAGHFDAKDTSMWKEWYYNRKSSI